MVFRRYCLGFCYCIFENVLLRRVYISLIFWVRGGQRMEIEAVYMDVEVRVRERVCECDRVWLCECVNERV